MRDFTANKTFRFTLSCLFILAAFVTGFSQASDTAAVIDRYLSTRTEMGNFSGAILVAKDGRTRHLELKDFRIDILDHWKSPQSGATYPIKWKVTVPAQDLTLEIQPEFPNQELVTNRSTRVTYWEGAVRAHRETFAGVEPANTTYFVSGFIPEGVLVEVELDAIVPEPR